MPTLFNADFFADAKSALSDFNEQRDTYNNALDALRTAANDLEAARDALETELQSVRDTLESALDDIKQAMQTLPCSIEEPNDCDDVAELELDFAAIENQ